MQDTRSENVQILVVGAGPAGLVLGITLARYGVRVLVVEKRQEIATLSRALIISMRSMEIIRSWGIEHEVRAGAADVEPCGWVTRSLASGEGMQMGLGHPTAAEAVLLSPTRAACAPQDHLEPILLAHLRTYPSAEIRFGSELVGLQQDDDKARALVHTRRSDQFQQIEALYVIGADGAHSTVRNQLGIRMEGSDNLGDYQRVEFQAPLGEIVGPRRYLLNVITHPEASGVLAPRGIHDRWGFSREVKAGQIGLVDLSPAQLLDLLLTATGVPDLRPDIERLTSFSFAAQLAEQYRDRRAFLAGDAAHRVTPRGGTGMNTAIHDAYDLGWKLSWVLRGWAEAELLDSYSAERRPVGMHNVTRSASPDGARRDAADAVPWDLNGRVAHHWVHRDGETVSTLDLLGDGLTVLAARDEPGWKGAIESLNMAAPVTVHTIDAPVAQALDLAQGGALLLRPDGRPVLNRTSLDPSHQELRVPRVYRRQGVV